MEFVNGYPMVSTHKTKGGNAYSKTLIYPDVETDKFERQNQLYI